MLEDFDGTRQAWRVPIYADLERDARQLLDAITTQHTEFQRIRENYARLRSSAPSSHSPASEVQHAQS